MTIELGETATFIREARKMTQRAAAEKLGITPVHLCNIEKGKAKPSPDLLRKYREVMGVDLYVLAWCRNGDFEKLPPSIRQSAQALSAAWHEDLAAAGIECP
jgi:transcriptional regulator with XRE-family HTH domain